jgi:uncharacterized membrane protein
VLRTRGLPLFRAALVSALIGHWIANAIADPIEYASVGLRYEGEAFRPILFQTAIVVIAVLVMTLASRLRPRRRLDLDLAGSRAVLTVVLATIQLVSFTAMEITERLALGEGYTAAFRSGVFDGGFAVELIVAIVSALLLVALAIALTRVVQAFFSGSRRRSAVVEPVRHIETPFVRRVLILAGSGGMRAPPSLLGSLPARARPRIDAVTP